jgi:cell division protein FtsN
MALRSLPSIPSRIFIRRPSLWSRIVSGSLLALSLLVTLAGLGTAIYLERARDMAAPAPSAAPPAILVVTEAPTVTALPPSTAASTRERHDSPPAAAAVSPPVSESPVPESPAVETPPAAGSSAPAAASRPQEIAALEAPPPAAVAPPPAEAAGHYWVEYGVFAGEHYAKRLQQILADHGLAAVVVATHAPSGRPLLRVRSPGIADHAEARAAADGAQQALGIGTLIHHSAGELAAMPAPSMSLAGSAGGNLPYWVQFGAFPHRQQAAQVKDALEQGGIDTAISQMQATSGRLLFLVRAVRIADRDSALALAHRGQQAANLDFLVGRNLAPRFAAHSQAEESPQRQ